LKNDDQKTYLEVIPHFPLSDYIRHVGRKNVVILASGMRGGDIAPSDLTRVVHTDEVA
jgi:hypothetical protein